MYIKCASDKNKYGSNWKYGSSIITNWSKITTKINFSDYVWSISTDAATIARLAFLCFNYAYSQPITKC